MAVHADIILTSPASRDDKSGYLRVNHREVNYLQKHAAECAAVLVSWPRRGDALSAELPGMALDTRRQAHPFTRNVIESNAGSIPTLDGDIA